MNETAPLEVVVTPPDSLLRYEAPIFVGLEPSVEGSNIKLKSENNQTAKMEDMLNSMIPPRYCFFMNICHSLDFPAYICVP